MREQSNSLKNTAMRSVAIITAVVVLPFLLSYTVENSPTLVELAQNATCVSAEIALTGSVSQSIDIRGREGEVSSGAVQSSHSEVKTQSVSSSLSSAFEPMAVSYGVLGDIELAPHETENPLPDGEILTPSPQADELAGALPYPHSLEERSGDIRQITYEKYSGWQFLDLENGGQVRNCTTVSNETLLSESVKKPEFTIENGTEPQVLIMHTHTTESYEPYSRNFYDASFCSRTTDTNMNVVAVGDAICSKLQEAGIAYIHDTTVHDYPNYNGSYQRSRETVSEILAKYPSIKLVLDIHRDALITEDGTRLAPTVEINGRQAAQVMIISGCDDGTLDMPNYLQNFRLASALQSQLETLYPDLTRPILFDYRKYNQDLTTGSLLIEMGSHANSIDEAVYSGQLVGEALRETLLALSEQ